MNRYELYVGCNVAGKPTHTPDHVRCVCIELLKVVGLDGATFTDCVGVWRGVEEKTVVCAICTDEPRAVIERFCALVRQTLEQECVMLVVGEPTIEFI